MCAGQTLYTASYLFTKDNIDGRQENRYKKAFANKVNRD